MLSDPTLVTGVGELVAEMRAGDTGKAEGGGRQGAAAGGAAGGGGGGGGAGEEEGALQQLPLAGPKALSANRISG